MSIKYVSKHYIKHVNNKQALENSVSLQQVSKHHNCSLFQSSLNILSGYFLCFSHPVWWGFLLFELMFLINNLSKTLIQTVGTATKLVGLEPYH